jgi:hypothetical protein
MNVGYAADQASTWCEAVLDQLFERVGEAPAPPCPGKPEPPLDQKKTTPSRPGRLCGASSPANTPPAALTSKTPAPCGAHAGNVLSIKLKRAFPSMHGVLCLWQPTAIACLAQHAAVIEEMSSHTLKLRDQPNSTQKPSLWDAFAAQNWARN